MKQFFVPFLVAGCFATCWAGDSAPALDPEARSVLERLIVTRGFTGELARWRLPSLTAPELARTVERALRCLPLRVDDDTGDLVEQESHCDI